MTGRSRPGRSAGLAAILSLTAACASSSPFEQAWESGRYAEAIQAFEADSSLTSDEQTLYRVALLRSDPRSANFAPEKARAGLAELLALEPDRETAVTAVLLDRLLAESVRASTEADSFRAALARADPAAEGYDLMAAQADIDTLLSRSPGGEFARPARVVANILAEVQRLRLSTSRLAARVRELEDKLEGVRQIDLEEAQPGGQ